MSDIVIIEFDTFHDDIQRKYEIIRPVLLKQLTAKERAMKLELHENTLGKYIRRFNEHGVMAWLTNGMDQMRVVNGLLSI